MHFSSTFVPGLKNGIYFYAQHLETPKMPFKNVVSRILGFVYFIHRTAKIKISF